MVNEPSEGSIQTYLNPLLFCIIFLRDSFSFEVVSSTGINVYYTTFIILD